MNNGISSTKISPKRWLYAVIGVLLLTFAGLIYAWSVFVAPLEAEFGWSRSETSLTFSICMSLFCLGGLSAGFISKKKSTKFNMILASIFLLSGFLMASRVKTLISLYLSYGVLCGFGVGLVYNSVLSTTTKWFPDRQGLISGILLMGFGFGGMILGQVATRLMNTIGWRSTFVIFGIVFCGLMLLGAFLLKSPHENFTIAASKAETAATEVDSFDMTPSEMIKRKSFWLFIAWAILLSASGLALIGHATPCAELLGAKPAFATFAAGLISIFNGLGRVLFGYLFDVIGRKKTMNLINIIFIIATGTLILAISSGSLPILVAAYVLTGLSYGGAPLSGSAFANKFYGKKNYSINFAIINLNLIVASFLGPYLAGVLQTASGTYLSTFICMLIFGVIAFVCNLFIKTP